MITEIVKEANLTGAKEEKLPYPMGNLPLSKKDCATEDQKKECTKYPYRRVVGQLMYGMVHTLITIIYALNILSRYGNNPGPRHIKFLKHLLKYCKYAKLDATEVSNARWTHRHEDNDPSSPTEVPM